MVFALAGDSTITSELPMLYLLSSLHPTGLVCGFVGLY